MNLRALLVIVLLVVTAGCVAHSRRDVLAETHRVALRLEMDDGVCSGTAVGPHLILSATHCFDDVSGFKVNGVPTQIAKRVDDGKDHTFLVVDITFTAWAGIGPAPVQGDAIHLWGNPGGFTDQFRHGYVAGTAEAAGDPVVTYDFNGYFGDSGSGIFNDSGQIVGVTTYCMVRSNDGATLKLMGSLPFAFTAAQYAEVGYVGVPR